MNLLVKPGGEVGMNAQDSMGELLTESLFEDADATYCSDSLHLSTSLISLMEFCSSATIPKFSVCLFEILLCFS